VDKHSEPTQGPTEPIHGPPPLSLAGSGLPTTGSGLPTPELTKRWRSAAAQGADTGGGAPPRHRTRAARLGHAYSRTAGPPHPHPHCRIWDLGGA